MAKKRISLSDIQHEDKQVDTVETISIEATQPMKSPPTINTKSEIGNDPSDFAKLSITIPQGMFERLHDISRERRRAKQPHTISTLVREALMLWPNMKVY